MIENLSSDKVHFQVVLNSEKKNRIRNKFNDLTNLILK